MGKITRALKSNVTAREIIHILTIVVIIFLSGWLIMYLYTSSVNKKLVDEKVSNIISLLEYRYYADYLEQKQEVAEYYFPEKDSTDTVLRNIEGQAFVNGNGEVALKLYFDDYCATKKYKDSKVIVEKIELSECLP